MQKKYKKIFTEIKSESPTRRVELAIDNEDEGEITMALLGLINSLEKESFKLPVGGKMIQQMTDELYTIMDESQRLSSYSDEEDRKDYFKDMDDMFYEFVKKWGIGSRA